MEGKIVLGLMIATVAALEVSERLLRAAPILCVPVVAWLALA